MPESRGDAGDQRTQSAWHRTSPHLPLRPLRASVEADVCVVGAGIAGLSTAYGLARDGRRVVVLDDGLVGGGETGRTTAHLTHALDDRYVFLERMHGDQGARLAADSHTAAIEWVRETVARDAIACGAETVDGYLFARPGEDRDLLAEELAACHRAGLSRVSRVARAPLDGFDTGPALRFPDQLQLHPLQYLSGLARGIEAAGGSIHTGTHATDLERGEIARVRTSTGAAVRARAVVVATNTPVFDVVTIHTKQAAYRSYVVTVPVRKGSVRAALYWDTGESRGLAEPYHYVRIVRGGLNDAHDLLAVGGEDHKTGQGDATAAGAFDRLVAWARDRFPVVGPPQDRWSGQVMEPVDGLAFIGREPGRSDNVFLATGDSGNGMTHGTIAGLLLGDLLAGRENPWASLYDPGRVTLKATPRYLRENANVVARFADWVKDGDVEDPHALAPGDGGVYRQGLKLLAVHRDGQGALCVRSAVCPHLACVVRWNGLEKTWDCPCHGSRFDAEGAVVNGPANRGLSPASLADEHPADAGPRRA